ncbi:monocarboxylate transporter 9-like isoform X2 [Ptychodera flava]|uniref:monocarboxylate transporter 9-like isoform X2 n=1 Tax=Ptychodera flava TaxID=63121 RepID=UPI00396A0FFB
MAFPPLYQILIDSYGWRGAFLIIAGMNSNIIVCGLLMRDGRPRFHRDKEQNNQDQRLNKSQELPEQYDERCETSFALLNQDTVSEIKESTSDTHTDVDTSKDFSLTENTSSRAAERNTTSQTMWLHRLTRNCWVHTLGNLGFHLFHSSFFVLMWILSFFLGIAYFTAMVFLMAKVVSAGVTRLDASFLMIISGICSLVGRLLHGSMVDLAKVSPLLVYGSHVFIGGLTLILIPLGRSYAVFAVLIGIFGYSYGVYYPVSIVCLKHKLGVQNLSSALGWIFFITGIGTLIGPPVAGTVYLCVAVAILFYYAYEKITLKTKRQAEKQDTDERE